MVLFKTVVRGCKVRNFGLEQNSVRALRLRRNQWTIHSAPIKRQASQFKIDGMDVIMCSFCVCCELSAVTRRECANVRTVTNKAVLRASLHQSCPVGYRRHLATSFRLHYSGKFERLQDSNDINAPPRSHLHIHVLSGTHKQKCTNCALCAQFV
jgi:hypothetical protein